MENNTTTYESEQSTRRSVYLERDRATATFMSHVFTIMGVGVGLTALTSYIVSIIPGLTTFLFTGPMFWVTMLVPLAYVFILLYTYQNMDTVVAICAFLMYSILVGISLGYIPIMYPIATLFGAFGISASSFVSLAVFGYTTKKDMSGWGNFLFMALIGLILALIVSAFIPGLNLLVSLAGVLIFAGLTAYDTQKIKDTYHNYGSGGNLAVIGALSLYLDFINLFLFILRMFGLGGSND